MKVYVAGGRFVAVEGSAAVYALPDRGLLARAEPLRPEMEGALAAHFGRPIPLRLVLDQALQPAGGAATAAVDLSDAGDMADVGDIADLEEAPATAAISPEQRLLQAFPGAEEVS